MVLAAIIETIDYTAYTCTVQMPDLQGVADYGPVVRTAVFSEVPGMQNSYKQGDKVWVAFVRDEKQYPVVIGKMSNTKDSSEAGGALNSVSLIVDKKAFLPSDTSFKNIDTEYNSISKIINKIKAANNFIETHAGLDYKLKNLASNSGPSSGSNNGGALDADTLASILDRVTSETITAAQRQNDFVLDFPIGKILYVKNDTGKLYSFQSELDIYPVFSLCSDYLTAQNPIIEFSNMPQAYTTSKLPGLWRVKDILSGGVLAQRYEQTAIDLDNQIILSDGATCYLNDDYGQPQSYYRELTADGLVYKSILSTNLVYLNEDNKSITELRTNSEKDTTIFKIAKVNPAYDPSDPESTRYIILQRYDGDPKNNDMDGDENNNDIIDNIVVLNIPHALINAGGYPCRFKTYTNQTTMFTHAAGAGTEFVSLPNGYNSTYKENYCAINEYLFFNATKLTTVIIPSNTGIIKTGAFSGCGAQLVSKQRFVKLVNFENSSVHNIKKEAFQNIAFENNCLKLPRLPLGGIIYFAQQSIGYHNIVDPQYPKLKTLFVNSLIDLDHEYLEKTSTKGAVHQGAIYTVRNYNTYFTNSFLSQMVFSTDRDWTFDLLKNSSIVSFLRTSADMGNLSLKSDDEQAFGSAVTAILNQFKESTEADFTAEVLLTNDISLRVRFIDFKNLGYYYDIATATPTIPTIIYNYS